MIFKTTVLFRNLRSNDKYFVIPIGRVISIEQAQLLRVRTWNSCWISLEDILLQLMERVMILSAITYVHWYDCITDYIL